MADVKIQFKLGAIEFTGEGDQDWLSKQLDKILEKAPRLAAIAPVSPPADVDTGRGASGPDSAIGKKTLAAFLKERNASSNQVKKFLATAVWLEAKGKQRITTPDVTRALKDSSQSRLGNPSECLSKNVSKGYCEKDGKEFYVTDEGKNSL